MGGPVAGAEDHRKRGQGSHGFLQYRPESNFGTSDTVLYGAVCPSTTLARIQKYTTDVPKPEQLCGTAVVYVRWNLENDDTYVGETENWTKRNEQHYMKTRAHEQPSKCKGCSEHPASR